MERMPYPTDENGVPYAPVDLDKCYEVCLKGAKSTNRHHLAYPRREHNSLLTRSYRESACMIIRACVCKHDELHATYDPPTLPSPRVMTDVAQGDIFPTEAEVFIRTKEYLNLENTA